MPSLANTERNQSKHGFHLFLRSDTFGHRETYRQAENLAGQFQAIK